MKQQPGLLQGAKAGRRSQRTALMFPVLCCKSACRICIPLHRHGLDLLLSCQDGLDQDVCGGASATAILGGQHCS